MQITLVNADIRDYLASAPEGHFSGVLSDGPYGIGITQNRRVGGLHWDSSDICFRPDFWGAIKRVVKPGGNVAAWGHSRTAHRQTMAIEEAGFRILDQVMHVKSHGYTPGARSVDSELQKMGLDAVAAQFGGFTTHLKSAHEPITIAANLNPKDSVVRTIANGGSGGLHTHALLVPTNDEGRARTPGRVSDSAAWSVERPIARSQPQLGGRLPTNVVFSHSEECNDLRCADSCGMSEVDRQGRGKYAGERASRFFSSLHYAPRAPASERSNIAGVAAPTVKSQEIATWIATLLGVREGTRWLDPFGGSGALSEAVIRLGGEVVYVEREAAYCELAKGRFALLTDI